MGGAAALAACALAAAGGRAGAWAEIPKSLLPVEVLGWTADGQDHSYDAETIFDYIDGAGEVYRAYNMKGLLSRRYKKAGKPDVIADLFDMGSPADAFGVFTHDLDGEDWKVGQGCVYKGGLLSFWKGRYFASLFAEDETEETKAMLLDLGRRLDAALLSKGEKPELLKVLPAAYADPKGVHYFHSPVILNYHFFVSADNILGLDPSVEGILVKAADKSALVIVRYPDTARAAAADKSFRSAFMPGAAETGPARNKDQTWTAAGLTGRILAVLFRGPTADRARFILDDVAARILISEK